MLKTNLFSHENAVAKNKTMAVVTFCFLFCRFKDYTDPKGSKLLLKAKYYQVRILKVEDLQCA